MRTPAFVLVIAALLLGVFSPVSAATVPASNFGGVSFETLPDDSEYVGTYSAQRCNLGQSWHEWGEWTKLEYLNPLVSKRVGTGALDCWDSYLTLRAKPGYTWEWKDGNLFVDRGYYLKKEK